MRKTLLFALVSLLSASVFAQTRQDFNKPEDSDPKAKALLDKVRKKYEGYNSMEAAFTLEIEFPEQPKETQNGKVARQGDKYRVELPSYEAICNGEAVWLIMSGNKEVQINNMPEPGETQSILSPESLFDFYNNGQFVYLLVNEYGKNGKVYAEIEFKPLDRNFDYTKIRMTVNKSTAEVVDVKTFGRDGSRFTLNINQFTPNKSFAANYFTFNKANYADYHVEDLRY